MDRFAETHLEAEAEDNHRIERAVGRLRHLAAGGARQLAEVQAPRPDDRDARGDDRLDRERAREVLVPRKAHVHLEVTVGVDSDGEHRKGNRAGADAEVAHDIGQRDLALVNAHRLAHLTVHDLEVEALEDLGRFAGQCDAKTVQVWIVENDLESEEIVRAVLAGNGKRPGCPPPRQGSTLVAVLLFLLQLEDAKVGADEPRALGIELDRRDLARFRIGHASHAGNCFLHSVGCFESFKGDMLSHGQKTQVQILVPTAVCRGRCLGFGGIPGRDFLSPNKRGIKVNHNTLSGWFVRIFVIAKADRFDRNEPKINRADIDF